MDRFTQYAVAAAKWQLQMQSLRLQKKMDLELVYGLVLVLVVWKHTKNNLRFLLKGPRRVSPFFVPMMIPDMAAGQVSIATGAKGINTCSVTACASGANSMVMRLKQFSVVMLMQ